MKPKFRKAPLCELCQDGEAYSFSYVNGKWVFACACSSETEQYYIQFDRFFKSPGTTVDWMAHMREKVWFDPNDFFDMMDRFRAATNSFNSIP